MSKEASVIQKHNAKTREYEYFVKGYDITESIKNLLKLHKETYDKENHSILETKGFIEAQNIYLPRIQNLEHRLSNCIELPVKIGDKIYVVPSETNYKINIINKHEERNKVYEFIVNEIRYNQYGYSVVSWVDNIPFFFLNGDKKAICECFETERFYNETWFTTLEEAKAKLREIQNG